MRAFTRRTALLMPLGLAGCGSLDNLLSPIKPTLKGTREPVSPVHHGLDIPKGQNGRATVPPPSPIAEWPQMGGNAAHAPGDPAIGGLTPAWQADIGDGTGYRQRMTATPVVAGGRVAAMDSNGSVSVFDLATGRRLWRRSTRPKHDRSTNVGGGVAASAARIWATTGRAEALAFDAATGRILWRKPIGAPARSAPTVADGRLYVTTLEDKLIALSAEDGAPAWSYQARTVQTTYLASSSPAAAEGFVVAGFGSGDLITVRAESGALAWSDSLASARAHTSLVDLSAINALPVIKQGRVYAIGDGGLFVAIDLRSGRRLWERDVGGSQTPVVAGDAVFVVTEEQLLAALNLADGHPLWVDELERYHNPKRQTGPVYWVGPLLAGGRLIIASSDRQLASFSPSDGKLLGSQRVPSPVSLPPVAAGGFVLLLTNDGTLRAFR